MKVVLEAIKNIFSFSSKKEEKYDFRIVKNIKKGWKVYAPDLVSDDGSWYVESFVGEERPAKHFPEDAGMYPVLFGNPTAYLETSDPNEVLEWVKQNTQPGEEYQVQLWKCGFSDYIRLDMSALKRGEFKISDKTSATVLYS